MIINRPIKESLPPLELDKDRYRVKHCPCGKSNKDGKFVPYVGFEDKGYCHGCGKTFLPEIHKNTQNNKTNTGYFNRNKPVAGADAPGSLISANYLKGSLQNFETNNFITYLKTLFGTEITNQLIAKYFIGTASKWGGATVFWQIDLQGKIRSGKIMLYSPVTGKRVKVPYSHIAWAHTELQLPDFKLEQCLFGEHLLKEDSLKPVAIVESEKTAIIASVYLSQFLWLAAGSLTNLKVDKCKILKGRKVVLFPDLNGFEKWSDIAKDLSRITSVQLSEFLHQSSGEAEKKQGFDLADYLVKYDYKEFTTLTQSMKSEDTPVILTPETQSLRKEDSKPEILLSSGNWDQEIEGLECFFNQVNLPSCPIKLNQYTTITNLPLFLESSLSTVKFHKGKEIYLPYLMGLQELKSYLMAS